MKPLSKLVAAALVLAALPTAAQARMAVYLAELSGNSASAHTGSKATATADITIDPDAQTVAIRVRVAGIPLAGLWDTLVAAPIGPIHLHQYAGTDLADPNASVLAFPVPFGASYAATANGFSVDTGPQPFAEGMARLGSTASFEQLVSALDRGVIVVNIHTDAFNAGEISGPAMPAKH